MASQLCNEALLKKSNTFVLKLSLLGTVGSPQIRRVRLSKLIKNGEVSYEELVLAAIKMTFPGDTVRLEDFQVSMTYYDVDNDCVTIASTDELIDAIEQFADRHPVLRITTDVKRVRNQTTATGSSSNSEPSPRHASRNHSSTSGSIPGQLHNVVESIVSVLATAVVALQTHVQEATNATSDAGHKANRQAAAESTTTNNSAAAPSTTQPSIIDAECEEVQQDDSSRVARAVVASVPITDTPTSEAMKTEEPRPFIHGRHTCDACLVTPIVGIRYHATNAPDYDLCSNCIGNYKGDDFKFEPAELDRDLQLQDRWHSKRAAKLGMCGRRGPHGRPNNPQARWGPYAPGHCQGTRNSPQKYRRGCDRGRWAPPQPMGMDMALKEAIRRSLQDAQKEQEKFDVQNSKKGVEVPIDETKVEMPIDKSEVEMTAPDLLPEIEDLKIGVSAPNGEMITAPCEELEKPNDVCALRSSSFASDAADNGEAAVALGVTLDKCADAIDAMMTEVERDMHHSIDICSINSDDESEADVIVEPQVGTDSVFPTPANDEQSGHSILGCGDVPDEDDVTSEGTDEWQVVNEDTQLANDEMIARAAQFLGSALFESEMGRNDAASHVDLNGSNISTASSALTFTPTLNSDVSQMQFDRWALQLSQLHELGFFDDAASVEILERYTAANIGCNSDDEVTVTRVVNELLKGMN